MIHGGHKGSDHCTKSVFEAFWWGFFWQCSLLQKTIQLENAIFNANLIIIRMRVLQTEIFFFFFWFSKKWMLVFE